MDRVVEVVKEVEKIVHIPQEKIVYVDKIVEKPVEVIKTVEIEKIVEKPVHIVKIQEV